MKTNPIVACICIVLLLMLLFVTTINLYFYESLRSRVFLMQKASIGMTLDDLTRNLEDCYGKSIPLEELRVEGIAFSNPVHKKVREVWRFNRRDQFIYAFIGHDGRVKYLVFGFT